MPLLGGKRAPFSGEVQPSQDTSLMSGGLPNWACLYNANFSACRTTLKRPLNLGSRAPPVCRAPLEGCPRKARLSPWTCLDITSTWESGPAPMQAQGGVRLLQNVDLKNPPLKRWGAAPSTPLLCTHHFDPVPSPF